MPIANLFKKDRDSKRATVEEALNWLLDVSKSIRPILVVDVSKESAQDLLWNERIQSLVIKRLLEGVAFEAERLYKDGQNLNTLVLIDEAHRLAPQGYIEDDAARAVRSVLIDAARTTRKYGLGWMFISQTLSSLHHEILQQMRIFFFGFGLGLGQEYDSLRQLIGSSDKTSLDLYKLFRDPHSAFDVASRQYSFMTIGPVSPLSFSGTPLFLNAFNRREDFLRANGIDL